MSPSDTSKSPEFNGSIQIADLRDNEQCLKHLTELYFIHEGKTKLVADQLQLRRNTLVKVIQEKMIPKIANFWIDECQGNLVILAQKMGLYKYKNFQKTLHWHQRFEHHIASMEVTKENRDAINRALSFLKTGATIVKPEFPPNLPTGIPFTPPAKSGTYNATDPDDPKSISQKITKLKTLRFGTIMILGETGAGKGWLSRKIYQYIYPDGKKPFIHINCAHLLSSAVELFGSEKGAYTDAVNKMGAFEKVADGGLLFLDEIDTLSMEVQLKLLLVLAEDKVLTRIGSNNNIPLNRFTLITATNQNLDQMVRDGKFREDLLGRISQPCIRLKSWKQQPIDVKKYIINELKEHILENDFEPEHEEFLRENFQFTAQQMDVLINANFSYNVRSVRKKITDFMAQSILDRKEGKISPFQL